MADIIKVKASGSAMVTEEVPQIAEYAEYLVPGVSYGYRHPWVDPAFPSGSALDWDMTWGAGNWQYVIRGNWSSSYSNL